MTAPYPLERLAELRALRATGAAIDLAAALNGEAAAEAAVAAARDAVAAARAASRVPLVEGEGIAPAWAVVRREAWALRLRRELARAQARLAEREAVVAEWREVVAAARRQAIEARAEHRVVELHLERREEAERKKRERRED